MKTEIFISQDDVPYKGNASAISDAIDAGIEQEISSRLDVGDIWAWALVEVRVTDENGNTESEYIGGCCYQNEQDFRDNSGYFEDMRDECATRLMEANK